ncbi:MAG: UDP-N-acetylmuramyl-tripeptide synthetase [Candidatus Saccharibacteria bacterium]|nr:UDP-N-acetylmuramyl-tripeptide synthetase [Candidatus Saccharibacteria bacterium]
MGFRTIVKKVIPTSVFRTIEPTGHLVEAMIMTMRYGFPGRKLKVIGVTGTNGKTTTSFMIHTMLHSAGIKSALITTVGYGIGDDIVHQKQHITSPKASVLQQRLKSFAEAGVEWVVLETSSHGLAQHRVWGVPYQVAVMTNITHDHLEYHGTFERYLEAKTKLFKIANKHGLRFGVANAEDPNADAFLNYVENKTTYGINKGDIQAKDVDLRSDGSNYTAVVGDETYSIHVKIPGEFNVSNSLAAISVGRKLGLNKQQIEQGIAALETVEGRMNLIDAGQKFKVIVDFASTPDGYQKFFESMRPLVKGKLIAVFGSAGRRDETKRAEQGAIAGKYADVLVITEEDDRDEDGLQIINQIADGAKKHGKKENENMFFKPNREEAIGFAMTLATDENDTVVLLGKGHEKTIERADGEYPWNETEAAKAAIESLLNR